MYLIDGHNLIGSGILPDVRLDQEDDEARLVGYLRARQPHVGRAITVVFDGGIPGGFSAALSGGGVTVTFAAQNRSDADAIILNRVRRQRTPAQLTVVSNDADLLQAAATLGAKTMRFVDFLALLNKPKRRPGSRPPRPAQEPKPSKAEVQAWINLFEGDDKREGA